MASTNQKIQTLITESRTILNAALTNPRAAEVMEANGYPPERIRGLLGKVDRLEELSLQQEEEDVERDQAYKQLSVSRETLREMLTRHRETCRAVFDRDGSAWTTLKLTGRTHQTVARLLNQAEFFYRMLGRHRDLLDELAPYNIDADVVDEARELLEAIRQAQVNAQVEEMEAQNATELRDLAAAELRGAMGSFQTMATLGSEDEAQLGELFGIRR